MLKDSPRNLLALALSIAIFLFGCGDPPPAALEPLAAKTPAESIRKPKLLLLLPAGGGALQVIIDIAAALEEDLAVAKLGMIIDGAGGSSSGAIAASALTQGVPTRYSARELKRKTPPLVHKAFPELNKILSVLRDEYGLTLVELNTLVRELMAFSTKAQSSIPLLYESLGAMLGRSPSIDKKLGGRLGIIAFAIKHAALIYATTQTNLEEGLRSFLVPILGNTAMRDASNHKLIALASHAHKPVFFAHEPLAPLLKVPQGILSTSLSDVLVASCAIPGLIKNFSLPIIMPDGSEKHLRLQDGVFASTPLNYDPSEHFYKLYSSIFPEDDLLMLYIGNGSGIDQSFRAQWSSCQDGLCQKREGGRTISFMAIDAVVTDSSGHNLFSLAQIDASLEMAALLTHAAARARESSAYKNALRTLRALGFGQEKTPTL